MSTGFQMLSKNAQRNLAKYETIIIWLMIAAAIVSIAWSISIHLLNADFNNGFMNSKLVFHKRDLSLMDTQMKDIFENDLQNFMVAITIQNSLAQNSNAKQSNESPPNDANESSTKRAPQIHHIIQKSSTFNALRSSEEPGESMSSTSVKPVPNNTMDEIDLNFFANMTVDVQNIRLQQSAALQFLYGFPFLTEIIAIIWTAMSLIFQTSVKHYWGLPNAWRIVLPSIVTFAIMTTGSLTYVVLAQLHLKHFCATLKAPLRNPHAISCGQAMTLLRPVIKQHITSLNCILQVYRCSYILNLVLWFSALGVMMMRFLLAVDFEMIDIKPSMDCELKVDNALESEELLLRVQQRPAETPSVEKSVDDFQSAKSELSEIGTPLLEHYLKT